MSSSEVGVPLGAEIVKIRRASKKPEDNDSSDLRWEDSVTKGIVETEFGIVMVTVNHQRKGRGGLNQWRAGAGGEKSSFLVMCRHQFLEEGGQGKKYRTYRGLNELLTRGKTGSPRSNLEKRVHREDRGK